MISRLLLAASLLCAAPAALAFDLGPLSPVISAETGDIWSISDVDGAAVFQNKSDPGAIRYYYLFADPAKEGKRTVTLDVSLTDPDPSGLGGILYGFKEDPRSYFLFTVSAGGTAHLHYFSPNGFEERISSSIDGLDPSNVTLSITEEGDYMSLKVNGREISGIGNERIGQGALGVVAVGKGTFGFKNFEISVN